MNLIPIFEQKYPNLKAWLPHITLTLWIGLLLIATNGQQSLMAHDEGWYATQSRWMFETGDWITPKWWGEPVYDRTIGIHWAIAACYSLFGMTDGVARLPNLITCILATLLTYEIGLLLLNRRVAWLGAAILCLCSLWLQYGRMATQDVPLICLELLGIWALLKAEIYPKASWKWRLLAGSTVGIGFMIKSVMIVLPIAALFPYLIWQHRRHHHLTSPSLYVGVILGAIPAAVWFGLTYLYYGVAPFQAMIGKLFFLGSKQYASDGNIIYYFWNIPLNSFPWALFAIFGMTILWAQFRENQLRGNVKSPDLNQAESPSELGASNSQEEFDRRFTREQKWEQRTSVSILIFYPILLFVVLTSFSTRTAYYSLQLYPFIGLLAAVAIDWLAHRPQARVPQVITYLFGGLAAILLIAFATLGLGAIAISDDVRKHLVIVPILGIGWLTLPFLWHQYKSEYQKHLNHGSAIPFQSQWLSILLAVFLITPWLTFATAGLAGLWGNYSQDLKTYLQQPAIASILQAQPINFVTHNTIDGEIHKTWILLSFYTPHLGKDIKTVAELPPASYAWISPDVPITRRETSLGNIRGWQLIKVNSR
ncbi:glycosyltransferase family 39 protein [Tumidithrix elongata RA019]|uniref:Glycosyltransferase family 39 protein n=1 Tax=Tumidithrix elongata BACA0141 TaxID=2716417 RepID=A0AAW9Q7Z5_9CYAN|nr:glycosyltransferase family 39 protein [Tumidithrix elongata RA019]